MKHLKTNLILPILISMVAIKTYAHDIEVPNADGILIYYVWTNDGKELSVSYRGNSPYSYSNRYTGSVVIPESVNYFGNNYRVTSIGNYAFYWCSGLTNISIPN